MARPTARYAITAEDKTKTGLNSVRRSLGGLRGAFAAVTAVSGAVFVAFTKSAFTAADELNKLNTQLGFSTEALSQYKFVAQQTGVEFNALTTGLQRMVRRVGEAAQGTGEAKNALFELGVDAQKLARLRPEEQFEVLADAFADVTNQGDKVRLAFKLFDTEGVRLLRTMEGGSAAVRELRAEFDRMGGTLTGDVADTATEAVDAIGRLRAQFSATSVELIRIFGPAITAAANWLAETIPKAVLQAERFLVRARQGFTTLAAGLADLFGQEEVANNLRDLASVYEEEFDQLTNQFGEFSANLGESVDASAFMDESLKRLAGSTGKQTTAQKALNQELARAKSITEAVRTPFEEYNATLAELEGLLDRARINQETFNRAAAAAGDELLQGLDLEIDSSALELYQQRIGNLRQALAAHNITQAEFNDILESTREQLLEGLGIDPSPIMEYTRALAALDEALAATAITFDEYARGRFELEEALEGALEGTTEKVDQTQTALEEFGKRAAQSIQSSFSEFLFDPFNSDLDGLVSNFTTALRQIASQVAANAVLQGLATNPTIGGLFGGLFGRALGGPVGVRTPSIVGERGPELLTNAPPGSQIIPNAGAGAININVTAGTEVTRETASQTGYSIGRALQDYMGRNA